MKITLGFKIFLLSLCLDNLMNRLGCFQDFSILYKKYDFISKDLLPNFQYIFKANTINDCLNICRSKICLGFGFTNSNSIKNQHMCILILQSNSSTESDNSYWNLNTVFIKENLILKHHSCESLAAAAIDYFQAGIYRLYSSHNSNQRYALCSQTGEGN